MRFFVPLILILCFVGAVAIGTRTGDPRAELTYTLRGSIHTLDPGNMSYMQDIHLARGIWEGLMQVDNRTGAPIPGAASGWPEVSADLKTYTFTIRDNARWSNGEPLVAGDFVRGWRRAIEPGTAETYAEMLSKYIDGLFEYTQWRTETVGLLGFLRQLQKREMIKGFDARQTLVSEPGKLLLQYLKTPLPDPPPDEIDPCWQRAINELIASGVDFEKLGDELLDRHIAEMDARFQKVGIDVLDDRRIRVRLRVPAPFFVELTSFTTYLPIHRSIELLKDTYKGRPLTEAALWTYDQQWTKPDHHRNGYPGLISNGPYLLKEWHFKERVRLEANPLYWDAANVKCKTVDALDIAYQNTAFMLYEQNRIDFLMDIVMDFVPELVQKASRGERRDIHAIPSFGTHYMTINCRPYFLDGRRNPLADRRVRRALTMATDRQALAEHVERLNNPITTVFVPPGQIPGYASPHGLDFDVERARAELAAAGYPNGAGMPVVELLFNTDGGYETKMQAMARMWEDNLNIRVQLVAKETKAYSEDKDRGRFMIARGGWFGDFLDPTTFLDLFSTTNGNNVGKFSDAKFDAMMATAANEVDVQKRLALLSEAEGYAMTEQLPILPLYIYTMVYAWKPEVTGLHGNPMLQFPLHMIGVRH